jgi:gluconokinase
MTALPDLAAIVVMGVSGSGKTTIAKALAKRLDWIDEDGDAFHPPRNIDKMSRGEPLTDADREPWLRAIAARIDTARDNREHLVVACSALKRIYRDILTQRRDDVAFVLLDGSRTVLAERLAARTDHFMPPGLLDSQLATLERPSSDEQAIVVSIEDPPERIVAAILSRLPAAKAVQ